MHGLVALDEHLEPLRPILSCVDFRNEKQNDEIYAKVGGKEGLLPYTNNKMGPLLHGGGRSSGCGRTSPRSLPGRGSS